MFMSLLNGYSELLRQIFTVVHDNLPFLIRTSKGMRAFLLRDFYLAFYDLPVCLEEILRELKRGESVVAIENSASDICAYRYDKYDLDLVEDDGVRVTELEICDFTSPITASIQPGNDYEMGEGDISELVDLFSEHTILGKRYSLLEHQSGYADQRLVERYNKEVAPDLNGTLCMDDVRRVFVVNYMGTSTDIGMLNGVFDLQHREDQDAIRQAFDESRRFVWKKVFELTSSHLLKTCEI